MPRQALRPRPLPWFVLLLASGLSACDLLGPSPGVKSVPVPREVTPDLRFSAVGAGWTHTCATATDGAVYCWGRNAAGELGVRNVDGQCDDGVFYNGPCTGHLQHVEGAPPFRTLEGSTRHSCGLDDEGGAWCWGFGSGGQLGTGNRPHIGSPNPVAGDVVFDQLDLLRDGTGSCGLDSVGVLYCWGPLSDTDMGGAGGDTPTPMPAELPFQQVDVGAYAGCGVSDGVAWCWGSNWYGQLGAGSIGQEGGLDRSEQPVAVVGGHAFSRVVVSLSHSCGLRTDGQVWCWGSLPSSDDLSHYGPTPAYAGGPAFEQLFGGGSHTCGLTAAGEAWCWGANDGGFIGDGTSTDRAEPARVAAPDGIAFQAMALGGGHSCGLSTDGRLFCWGSNWYGQVGDEPGFLKR